MADPFIYVAADAKYFDGYGRAFFNSLRTNSPATKLHIHLFDPSDVQLRWLEHQQGVAFSWEAVDWDAIERTTVSLMERPIRNGVDVLQRTFEYHILSLPPIPRKIQYLCDGILYSGAGRSISRHVLRHWTYKAYIAAKRFVHLASLVECPTPVLAIDIDALVLKPLDLSFLRSNADVLLFSRTGSWSKYLAGAIGVPASGEGVSFVREFARELQDGINSLSVYWGLDQHALDRVAAHRVVAEMPDKMIHWDRRADTVVWTAKGPRKSSREFLREQRKWLQSKSESKTTDDVANRLL